MARITVELPTLLRGAVGGASELELEARSLKEALERLVAAHPELEPLLFEASGAFREHVLCFVNGTNTRWLEEADRSLADGDTLRILQAVSGG